MLAIANICRCKFSAKVALMLDNPFLVPSFCKLNHISLCFIQISTKLPANCLFPFRESNFFFFEVIPSVLGRSVNFNITKTFIKTACPTKKNAGILKQYSRGIPMAFQR